MIHRLRPPLRRAALAALVLLGSSGIALLALGGTKQRESSSPQERPTLLVLTSLPLLFPEAISLSAPASPVAQALRAHYQLIPISVADPASLNDRRLLLMAQPRAQPPEDLVALDAWVRAGGKVLLLADPALQWPSERPIGDPLRPPFAFADTGLLAHWGLALDGADTLGSATVNIDGTSLSTRSPGRLVATSSGCDVGSSGLVARCRLGKGEAMVIADSDFLAPDLVEANRGAPVDLLLAELDWLRA